MRARFLKIFLVSASAALMVCVVAAQSAPQQQNKAAQDASTPASAAAQQQNTATQNTAAQNTSAQPQKLPTVKTTVEVHADIKDTYRPDAVDVGTLLGGSLNELPLSATVITRGVLEDQGARVLSDVLKNDASVGEDYAPVGYYGDFAIRGFPIDLATGLQINGMTVTGEQDVPLENKERVEVLKGIAGIESGVASAGGLINFVTKRPSPIYAMDWATDHRGSVLGDVDLGHLFGSAKQVGARVNLAGERIASYVNGANGWRAVGAGSADWHISPVAILKTDFEYQHKTEASVCGYQLLGGDEVPDIHKVSPATMLGEQSWAPPNTFDTWNAGTRLDYDLPHEWHAFGAASFSRSLINDNVIYAYGCAYEADCYSSGGNAPDYFFAPDGGYDIYDYRDPGELRIDAEAEAIVSGKIHTGAVTNEVAAGGEIFRRSVQQPGAPPPGAPSTVADGSVYAYIGSENIYQPLAPFAIEDPVQSAGPVTLYEDNHQSALILQDRLHLPGRIDLIAGGRLDSLRDDNYSGGVNTDKLLWLPTYAATFSPGKGLMLYGNYSVLLSLGIQAPWWAGSYFLSPFFTRQAEVGAKYEPGSRILLTAAFYRMRAPFFYPKGTDNGDDLDFVSEGRETHDGVEVGAQGRVARWLQVTASAAAANAVSSDTGTPSYDNKQVINAPKVRTAVFADVRVAGVKGLHVMPGWGYTSRKEATRDDAVSVAGYNLFNLGARYTPGGEQGHVTLRLYADNITDRRYWKDTGANYGDTFIHLGAPTTVRLSAHYTF